MLETAQPSRRKFLQLASTFAIGSLTSPTLAAEKTRPARMKLSLSAYSFNRFLPRNWYLRGRKPTTGQMSLFDVMDFAADVGCDAVELTAYYFPKPLDPLMASEIKNHAFRLGLDISGTAIGNDFCLQDGPELEEQVTLAKRWIAISDRIDAPVIRIFAGKVPKGGSKEATIDRCAAVIASLLPDAEKAGVVLALENHGGITAEPEDMLAIIDKVGPSPWFGVNFDGGNFRLPDPYAALERIAPHAVNAQLKMAVRLAQDAEKSPADLERTIEILKAAKYRGYVAIEYEEDDDPRATLPAIVRRVRSLIDAANA